MRTGAQYLQSLADGRTVILDGARVENISQHPAFAGIARTVAAMYDVAGDPAHGMIYTSPEASKEANQVFMIPRSRDDLAKRRLAILTWAEISKGFVGRSPDHVGGFLAGFASAPEVFDKGGRKFGQNVARFYRQVVEENLFVTYVIIPPQIDRSTTAHGWSEELLQVGVLQEQDGGFVVRGSQMLGTATAVSDWLFVSCIKPLAPQDERYALSFVLPLNAKGLKVYCRRPYASGQPSSFDYPLSTRFDESDALIVFDDVFVPWENVFVYRDTEQVRRQFFETAAHVLGNTQAQIRLIAKMKFILGVARRITQVNGIEGIPSVQEKLGDLASLAAIVEGMVLASEATSTIDRYGVAKPNPRFLYGAMGLQAELYPRAILLL
ncbi:MAG: 4-hydroxyphenylacetate 3-hydroxylase family protein, partial [Terriglobia bacterium]